MKKYIEPFNNTDPPNDGNKMFLMFPQLCCFSVQPENVPVLIGLGSQDIKVDDSKSFVFSHPLLSNLSRPRFRVKTGPLGGCHHCLDSLPALVGEQLIEATV